MASDVVTFKGGIASVSSRSDLFGESKSSKMQSRVVYGALLALVVVVVALVIALAVIATKDNRKESSSGQGNPNSEAQTGVFIDLPTVDCSFASTDLEKANCVLDSYPMVDGHNDMPVRYRFYSNTAVYDVDMTSDLRTTWNRSHTDIPRLRKGKVGAQFWASYVSCKSQYKDAVRLSLEQIDVIRKYVTKYPDTFQWVTTAQGIVDAFRAGRVGSLVGLEGGHSIDSSLGALRMFYDLGVRYMTVTHSCSTPWADNWIVDSQYYNVTRDGPKVGGLTEFGKLVILEMNRLGMLVDLSHVAKATMIETLKISRAPVIHSHTSAWAKCNSARNVQDDVLQMTKANGGLVMVNFYAGYINCYPSNQTTATLAQVADHIDYIKDLIGVDHVGIGADYDGVPSLPVGLEDVSTYPDLFAELVQRGWQEEDLQKVAGRNLVRVFRQAERVKAELSYEHPYEDMLDFNVANPNGGTCATRLDEW